MSTPVEIKVVPVTVYHYYKDRIFHKCLLESVQPKQDERFPFLPITAIEIRCLLDNLTKDSIYAESKSLHHILETFGLGKLEQSYNSVVLNTAEAIAALTRSPLIQFGVYRNRRLPLDALVAGWFILTGMLQSPKYTDLVYDINELRSRLARSIISALKVIAGQADQNQPVRVIYNNLVVYTDTGQMGDRELRIVVDAEIYQRYLEQGYTDEQLIARLDRNPDDYYVFNDYRVSSES